MREEIKELGKEKSLEILKFYKIKNGETISQIAIKNKVPTQVLIEYNHPLKFFSGVTIAIPKQIGEIYIVKLADTIDSICEKFHISKAEFKVKNKVNFIFSGMILWV